MHPGCRPCRLVTTSCIRDEVSSCKFPRRRRYDHSILCPREAMACIIGSRIVELTRRDTMQSLPLDPVGHTQRLELFIAPDGIIYAAQCSILSRSSDGRSWTHLHRLVSAGKPNEPPPLPDDHFLNFRVLPSGEWIRARTDNENGAPRDTASAPLSPSEISISVSTDEGNSWEEVSRIGADIAAGTSLDVAVRLGSLEVDGQGGVLVVAGMVFSVAGSQKVSGGEGDVIDMTTFL